MNRAQFNSLTMKVRSILAVDPKARNSDAWLFARYVQINFPTIHQGTARDLLRAMHQRMLPSMESLSRARRKAQELNPHLRGTNYSDRQNKQQDWKSSVQSGDGMSSSEEPTLSQDW